MHAWGKRASSLDVYYTVELRMRTDTVCLTCMMRTLCTCIVQGKANWGHHPSYKVYFISIEQLNL
jgi:hypothetical protein